MSHLFVLIESFVICYLFESFSQATFNIQKWAKCNRDGMAWTAIICWVIISLVNYFLK